MKCSATVSTAFMSERVLLGGSIIPVKGYGFTRSAFTGSSSIIANRAVAVTEKNVPSGSFMKKVDPAQNTCMSERFITFSKGTRFFKLYAFIISTSKIFHIITHRSQSAQSNFFCYTLIKAPWGGFLLISYNYL